MTIPFIDVAAQTARLREQLDAATVRVLDHGGFINGPEVGELEARLAERAGVAHVVSCSNGTDAIVLALRALGVGPGDAVLIPSFTFAATAGAVAMAGATPVFLDCHEATFDVDAAQITPAATVARELGLEPKAVMPVDLFGQPADHDAVADAAAAAGLDVVVDAAQSFGSTWHGRPAGSIGRLATTSFFPAKPLGCFGDGGAIFTDDGELAEVLRSLRTHGQGRHKYENVRIGANARLDTLQAAVLLEKLTIFDDELERRQCVADRYASLLSAHVTVPAVRAEATSVWAQYTIRVPRRDKVAERLRAAGVPTAVYYPTPLHRQPAYAAFPAVAAELPVSDRLSEEVLSLPMHPYLSEATQDLIVTALLDALKTEAA